MPTVTGTIREPDGSLASGPVTFRLVGSHGRPLGVAHVVSTGAAVEGTSTVDLVSGAYSIVLPDSDDIVPAGTRWQRTHARSGPVLLHVQPSPSTQDEADIFADPPGTLASAALDAHAADDSLHGGGQELAVAHITVETSTTGTALVDITGATITFDAPAGPYIVESIVPVQVSGADVRASVALSFGIANLTSDQVSGSGVNQRTNMVCRVRVPTPHQNHTHPGEGTEVTYYLRLARDGGGAAGTVQTLVTSGGLPVREAHIQAYTLGAGA